MKKLFFLLVIIFGAFTNHYSQEIIYRNSESQLQTQAEVDDIQRQLEAKMGKLDMVVQLKIKQEEVRNDTIFRDYTWNIISKSLVDQQVNEKGFIDKPLPPFEFKDLNGNNISSKDLLGKVVFINFWFTTCAPCIAEMPALNELKKEYKEKDVLFIAMAPENAAQIQEFLNKRAFNFQHLYSAREYIQQFGIGYPKNILVDRQGNVRLIEGGLAAIDMDKDTKTEEDGFEISAKDLAVLKKEIDALLAEKP